MRKKKIYYVKFTSFYFNYKHIPIRGAKINKELNLKRIRSKFY